MERLERIGYISTRFVLLSLAGTLLSIPIFIAGNVFGVELFLHAATIVFGFFVFWLCMSYFVALTAYAVKGIIEELR